MTKRFSTALAVLLLAGASGAAMAQDRDHGERGQSAPQGHPQPQPQQHAGPPGSGQRGPGGGEHAGPAPGGGRGGEFRDRGQQGPGGGERVGHEVGNGAAPSRERQPERQFDRQPERQPGRQPDRQGGQHFDRPGAPGHAEARPGQFGGGRGAPQHWQPGRFPPVFQAHQRFHAGAYRAPPGYSYRAWGFGQFLPRGWFVRDYWLNDFLDFGLPYPPPGYEWVRVGPDAIMVDSFTGRIVQVVRGVFW